MIDILSEIVKGKLTVDQAYDIMDELMEKYHDGELEDEVESMLGLNNFEWTAICHSLDILTLANWRLKGWPKECSVCGSDFDYKNYNWIIKENKIKCLNCC